MHRPSIPRVAAGLALACAGAAQAADAPDALATATPIKHLVVLFDENVSFDHYFATYPQAANPPGEPAFQAPAATPAVDNLRHGHLLDANPNAANPANGKGALNPFRLDRSQAATADQGHGYSAEQQAYDAGRADLFPLHTGRGSAGGVGAFGTPGLVMGYYDGNTVTALWNYAAHFAMSDAAYTDTYGPSTPGALEAVAGQTDGLMLGADDAHLSSFYVANGDDLTVIGDVDPSGDVCSNPHLNAWMRGRNIGDLLNAKGISWGGFMAGFDLGTTNADGSTGCKRSTMSAVVGAASADYIAHHNWFQYYPSTANPTHARPSSIAAIGSSRAAEGRGADPANHEYDLDDFYAALRAGNFPAVSFLKAPAYQDGHAGYSDPLDEQAFLVRVINFIEQQPDWKNTAIVIAWDDSDGWYDHAFAAPTSASFDAKADQLDGAGRCGKGEAPAGLAGQPVNGRCGPGTRLPFLVVSPWARANAVSHTPISQASIVRFIEDNWLGGQRLGGGSFDASAGRIDDLFDFQGSPSNPALLLNEASGTP
jgi:phospholipase C